jgi:hypothetical protein
MLTAFLAASLIVQTKENITTPIVPFGSNTSFQEAVHAVEEATSKNNFDEAKRLLKALPSGAVTVTWDDSKVPAEWRAGFADARDKAFKAWSGTSNLISFKVVPKGHLVISFDPQLPDGELGIPKGAGHLFSIDPNEPRLHTVISLKRGKPAYTTLASEVVNEVQYAIAAYFGAEKTFSPGTSTYRSDLLMNGVLPVSAGDLFIASRFLKVADTLRKAVDQKVPLNPARAKLYLESMHITAPEVIQGEEQIFVFNVTNNGEGTLALRVAPDCLCLSPYAPNFIEPGKTDLIRVRVNTVDFVGKLRKWLYVYSNDPDFPALQIPVDVNIKPLFRLLREGPSVLQMGDNGVETDYYFWTSEPDKLTPTAVSLAGLKGSVTTEAWEGEMADPEVGESKMHRKGFKYHVRFEPAPLFGRVPSTLNLTTNHPIFKSIYTPIQIQRGIVALPERVYMGEIPKSKTTATFQLSRPEINFKILKMESDSPYLKVTATPSKGAWEYKVDVEFDGKMDFGLFHANIVITTDDPKQPQVIVPVEATVR